MAPREDEHTVKVERVKLDEYRSDPVRYERMASETVRVVVQQDDGSTYASIGGRSVFDPSRDL